MKTVERTVYGIAARRVGELLAGYRLQIISSNALRRTNPSREPQRSPHKYRPAYRVLPLDSLYKQLHYAAASTLHMLEIV
jgi:hypothetical protein